MYHPTPQQCMRLLEGYDTPSHVRAHCRAVAHAAYLMGRELNKHGHHFDLDLVLAAGLLHDIARVEEDHAASGALIMRELGCEEEAAIIEAHMKYGPFSDIEDATETDMICLADRTVKENSYVGLEERMQYLIDKVTRLGRAHRIPSILEKKKDTKRFILQIEDKIGMTLDELLEKAVHED